MKRIKNRFEGISWSYRLLIILGLLYISTIIVSHSFYKKAQTVNSENVKSSTKQEIRTLLESINPEILRRIDVGRKEILVCISTQDVTELSNLSKLVDFDKYLSFRQVTIREDSNDLEDPNIYIENDEYLWATNGYYLYPKDALIK